MTLNRLSSGLIRVKCGFDTVRRNFLLAMSKPKVWVHATEDQIARNGWRTEFLQLATQHFDLVTAQGGLIQICV